MAAARPFDLQIKLLMIGDSAVGKTSLLLRYANDTFSSTFITTIGIDFKIKTVDLDGRRVKLQIWDTAGQEQFRTITRSYFRGAQGIVLVYDITDRGTFNSVRSWMAQIADHADAQVNRVLVANKSDNEAERRVSSAEGAALAAEYEVKFLETSAAAWEFVRRSGSARRRDLTVSTQVREARHQRVGDIYGDRARSGGTNPRRGRGVDARRYPIVGDERQKEVVLLRLELARGGLCRRPYIIFSTKLSSPRCPARRARWETPNLHLRKSHLWT